jgi:hypothetical protein
MNGNLGTSGDGDICLENFAAELTSAAYPVALCHGVRERWLDLQLDLWRELTETVKQWGRQWPPAGSSDEFEVWWDGLLVHLTEGAFSIALKHGIKGSLLEVEFGLYRALRSVIRRVGQEALPRQLTRMRQS